MRSGFFTALPAAPPPRRTRRRRGGRPRQARRTSPRCPRGPGQAGRRVAEHRVAVLGRPLADGDERRAPILRRADDAALPDPLAARPRTAASRARGSPTSRPQRRAGAAAPCVSEMNERSATTRSGAYGSSSALELARVAPLDHRHARVVAQPPVELAVGDVERHHVLRAALEQAVGEPARGRARRRGTAGRRGRARMPRARSPASVPRARRTAGPRPPRRSRRRRPSGPGFSAGRRSSPTRMSPASTAAAAARAGLEQPPLRQDGVEPLA